MSPNPRTLALRQFRSLKTILSGVLVFALAQTSFPSLANAKDTDEKWDLTPYRVMVALSFDSSQSTRLVLREELSAEIRDRLHRLYGKMWQVTVADRKSFAEIGSGGLKNLNAEKALAWYPENNTENPEVPVWDKVFFAHVNFQGSNLVVACREWDALSRTLSSQESRNTSDPRQLAQQIVSTVKKTFRPLISISRTDNVDVFANLKAGTITAHDPASNQLETNDVVLPFFRYLDKEKHVKNIQFMPWTYLIVDKVEKSYLENTLITGLRSPLGTNRRRNVQLLGLKMNLKQTPSTLQLVLRSVRTEPMIGMRVETFGKRQYRDKSEGPPGRFYSNRRGEVSIPVNPKMPIVWAYVYSGKTVLARVPFVPGSEGTHVLSLKDDSIRLRMEGDFELMLGDLIDLVAKRSSLAAQAKTYARNDRSADADKKLAEIDKLPNKEFFEQKLKEMNQRATDAVQAVNNRWAKRRIGELAATMTVLINEFLNPAKIDEIRVEVEKIKLGESDSG